MPRPSSDDARNRMLRQARRNTSAEKALRSALHRRGLRFRLHQRLLHGSRREVDIVFPSARVAVFVDGCFWHGCPKHGTSPKQNADWWRAKIEANVMRDRDTDVRLLSVGWLPVRIWEHEPVDEASDRIASMIRARQVERQVD